jgi:MFS family permease
VPGALVNRSRLPALLLAAWVAFHLAAFGIWVHRSGMLVVEGDSPWYQVYALDLYQMIAGETRVPDVPLPSGLAGVVTALGYRCNYPALYFLQMGAAFALLGETYHAALWTSAPYLALLLVGVYLLGARLADRWTGLLAAFFVGCYPGILGIARSSEEYHPVAALLPWLLLALLATDRFRRPLASAGLGVLTGIAILVKGQILFFVGVPFLVAVGQGIAPFVAGRDFRGALPVARNFLVTIGGFLLVSAPWWGPNFGYLLTDLFRHLVSHYLKGTQYVAGIDFPMAETTTPWTAPWAIKYAGVTWTELSPGFAGLFLLGGVVTIARRVKNTLFPWLVVLCPYAIFTLISGFHHPRYYFPAFAGMALLTAMGVRAVPWPAARRAIVAAAAAYFAVLVLPRAIGPDLVPGVARAIYARTVVFFEPSPAHIEQDVAALEAAIGQAPPAANRYVEWVIPERLQPGSEKLEFTFGLMARRPEWLFQYQLPSRAVTAPLGGELFRRRIDTLLVWDPESRSRAPEGARFAMDGGVPAFTRADGSRGSLADAWEGGWAARVAGWEFLGAVPLAQFPVVVWVFAKPPRPTP